MNSNDNEMSKILINGLLQKFFKNVEKNFHIIGLINMMTIAIPTVLIDDFTGPAVPAPTVLCNILENINEIPSPSEAIENKKDILKSQMYEIKNILEYSIHKWVNKGYTFEEIFYVFQRINFLISKKTALPINQKIQ